MAAAAAAVVIGFGAQRIGNYRGNRRGAKLIAKINLRRLPLTRHADRSPCTRFYTSRSYRVGRSYNSI